MKHLIFVSTVVAVLIFAGCGGQKFPSDMPPIYPQRIIVTQGGAPLAGIIVGLHPVEESKWNAAGLTDANGVADIFTHGMYRGAVEGKYKVTLFREQHESRVLRTTPDGIDITETTIYSLVELKYTQPGTTPLEIEVTRRNTVVTFDIEPVAPIVTDVIR